jgi:micrococcal nuclease
VKGNTMYSYNAKIINIVDGDTVDAEIDLGFKLKITHRLRLIGIDTPELTAPDPQLRQLAQIAKDYMVEKLLNQTVKINTYKADSFGRYLAEIYIESFSVNDYLIESGMAKKWKR